MQHTYAYGPLSQSKVYDYGENRKLLVINVEFPQKWILYDNFYALRFSLLNWNEYKEKPFMPRL